MSFIFDAAHIESLSLKICTASVAIFFAGLAGLFSSMSPDSALSLLLAKFTIGTAFLSLTTAGIAFALVQMSRTVSLPADGPTTNAATSLGWWAERLMIASACGLFVSLAITAFAAVFVVGPL